MNRKHYLVTAVLMILFASSLTFPRGQKQPPDGKQIGNPEVGAAAIKPAGKPTTPVFHDATLAGDGTQTSPLGVALPLTLGTPNIPGFFGGNTVTAWGVNTRDDTGGVGTMGIGGNSVNGAGGNGLAGIGGSGLSGGDGIYTLGGSSDVAAGGVGGKFFGGSGVIGGPGIIASRGIGINGGLDGKAGVFFGDVAVNGLLSKGGGSFKIDHPLDPENKYLSHSFVESPDMMNIYNGNVTTDETGKATVTLPEWFEVLNRDFRYQLTVIGTFAQAIVADEVKDNSFVIQTSTPKVKVSWQVTGIRHDSFATKNRIAVEEVKTEQERGYYLHPEVFNQPVERGIEWTRDPQSMRQVTQQPREAGQKRLAQ